MVYLVYAVSFVTARGAKRCHEGHTASLDVRRHWHERRPPAWMKAAGKTATFSYEVLEEGIARRGEALAAEALWAARRTLDGKSSWTLWRNPADCFAMLLGQLSPPCFDERWSHRACWKSVVDRRA